MDALGVVGGVTNAAGLGEDLAEDVARVVDAPVRAPGGEENGVFGQVPTAFGGLDVGCGDDFVLPGFAEIPEVLRAVILRVKVDNVAVFLCVRGFVRRGKEEGRAPIHPPTHLSKRVWSTGPGTFRS